MRTAKEVIEPLIGQWFDVQTLIEILGEAGYVIAPKEPTPEMIAAGMAAEYAGPSGDPAAIRRSYDPAKSRYETLAAKYRAMIAKPPSPAAA